MVGNNMEVFSVEKILRDKSDKKRSLKKPEECPVCGKKYKIKDGKCMYCGTVLRIFHW